MTGAREQSKAAIIVFSWTWEMSTIMPRRFIYNEPSDGLKIEEWSGVQDITKKKPLGFDTSSPR